MSTANSPAKQPVALIAGPTASGKSALALALADALVERGRRVVIVNADSMQVYRDIPIVSAAPDADEMARHPHRLYGAWDGAVACSAAGWAERAKQVIAEVHDENGVPILVGGTGMYIKVLLEGIAPIPEVDPKVRMSVRNATAQELRRDLLRLDPDAASRLGANDTQRMARALEVVESTGKPLSYWQERKEGGIGPAIDLHPLIVLPDREWLYERCDRRFEWMLRNGAIGEVERLLARNLDPALPVMRAIGVPEIAHFLSGQGQVAQYHVEREGARSTRQYAKRQYTWFRRQPPADWPRAIENLSSPLPYFVSLLQNCR